MPTTGWLSLEDRLRDRIGDEPLDLASLARVLYDALAQHLDYDFACFAATDPASGVVTWTSKTRDLGLGDEEFAAAEFGSPTDVIKFADLAQQHPSVAALSLTTGGHPEVSHRHREFMQPRFGFTDELRAAFVSRGTCWGALGVYRGPGDPPFDQADVDQVITVVDLVATAIQRSLFRRSPSSEVTGAGPGAPAVLIVDAGSRVTQLTPAARIAIEDLGGYDHGSLPATVLGVVATTRLRRESVQTRTQLADGRWLSIRAALLDDEGGVPDVVVTIDPMPRSMLSRLALDAHGLTTREEDVAVLVLQGVNTQGIAESLHLSPHTVQDHLKTIFTKLGVRSRREMTARLTLD